MIDRQAQLKAKVAAVNKAHQFAGELYDLLIPVFADFVGDKIIKSEGGLMAKVEKRLPPLPSTVPLLVYRNSSNYSLSYTVKTCEQTPDNYGCVYYEATVSLGTFGNNWTEPGVLKELSKKSDYRSNYTVEEILAKRETLEHARQAFDHARSDLYPFGEHE